MKTEKLFPAVKDYIWGGNKLKNYGVKSDESRIAEAWVLSMHKDGESLLADGTPLSRAVTAEDLGTACKKFGNFPVLVKLIDAKDNLSVQVHPSDAYAKKYENSFGKTEMWYILECEENAGLYLGLNKEISKTEFTDAIRNGTLTDLLKFVKVKKGDCFFIPAGTLHAIGKGCTICEVQQNSNVTYRVFDYNRLGADGKPRDLHIEKAIDVSDLTVYSAQKSDGYLADCEYFTVALKNGKGTAGNKNSFTNIVITEGTGTIDGNKTSIGDSWFIPAGKTAVLDGAISYMEIFVK